MLIFLRNNEPLPSKDDNQLTTTSSSLINSASTLPVGRFMISSIIILLPKVIPLSLENFKLTFGTPFEAENHDTTTLSPFESIFGPLTGHPLIIQLSS